MLLFRRMVAAVLLATSLVLSATGPAYGQAYPAKAISLVVPWPAGGRTDLTARIVAHSLQKQVGVPVVVVNKPGAGGVLGAKEVALAAADGYTLGFFSSSIVTTQYTVPTPVNLADYTPLAIVNVDPAAIAIKFDSPWKTLADLVDYGRKNPRKLRVGMAAGASTHLFAAAFLKAAKIEAIYVPFKGEADTVAALAGGHIDLQLASPASFKALAEANKVRVLGVASQTRSELYAAIPTLKEGGVDLAIGAFHGVFAPKATPAAILSALAGALDKTMHDKTLADEMRTASISLAYLNARDAGEYLKQQDVVYKALIQELGLMASSAK